MPGQQRGRGDDPMDTQLAREQPGQSGQDRPVRPSQARPGHLAAQYCDFVAQDEDLDVLGSATAGEQSKPAKQPEHEEIQQSEQHGR
jgi:hypothetical protein